jgi:hypothetical protein
MFFLLAFISNIFSRSERLSIHLLCWIDYDDDGFMSGWDFWCDFGTLDWLRFEIRLRFMYNHWLLNYLMEYLRFLQTRKIHNFFYEYFKFKSIQYPTGSSINQKSIKSDIRLWELSNFTKETKLIIRFSVKRKREFGIWLNKKPFFSKQSSGWIKAFGNR